MHPLENKENIKIEITTGTIARAIILILFLVFLYLVRDLLGIFLFAVIIASAVEPIAHWAEKYRIPRLLIILFVYIAAFAVLGSAFYLIVPPLLAEFFDFANQVPSRWLSGTDVQTLFGFAPNLPSTLADSLVEISSSLQSYIEKFTAGFFHTTASIFGGALSFVLIVILSFYLSVQEHGIEKFIEIVVPAKYEKYILDLWMRSQLKMGRWFQGQILLGALVGILVFLGLTILGVKYALILAILAAVLELLPIFGPVIAAIPAIGIAFLQSPSLALMVVVFYIIVQQFENHLIYPVVVSKIVGVPSIVVVIAMIIGGTLGGLWGILLSVPVSAVLIEFLRDVEARKKVVAQ